MADALIGKLCAPCLHDVYGSSKGLDGAKACQVDLGLIAQVQEYFLALQQGLLPAASLKQAWAEFFRGMNSLIFIELRMFPLQQSEIEDCSQDAWIKVFTKLPLFHFDPARGRFEGWLARLTDHTCLDYLRSRAARPSVPWKAAFEILVFARELSPDAAFVARSQEDEIRGVMENLRGRIPPWSHQVLQLRWIEGWSASEIAVRLNVKPPQVWYGHHRGWPILCERIRQTLSEPASSRGVRDSP